MEKATGDTWRNVRHELDRMHLVTLATGADTVAQRSALTAGQKSILTALDLSNPAATRPHQRPKRPAAAAATYGLAGGL